MVQDRALEIHLDMVQMVDDANLPAEMDEARVLVEVDLKVDQGDMPDRLMAAYAVKGY